MHRACRDLIRATGLGNLPSLRIQHNRVQRHCSVLPAVVFHLGSQTDSGFFFGNFRRGHKLPPMRNVNRISRRQPNSAINPRARIPATAARTNIRLNRDHIFTTDIQVRRQIVTKANIAKGTNPKQLPVYPHLAVHVDAVKIDEDLLALSLFGYRERFAIPTDPTRQITHRHAARHFRVEFLFDTPVVRHIQRAPCGIVVLRLFRARDIAQMELPVFTEVFADTRCVLRLSTDKR